MQPENVLLNSTDADAIIKIADFGFAKKVDGRGLNTACGTPGYVAPEILSGVPYGLGEGAGTPNEAGRGQRRSCQVAVRGALVAPRGTLLLASVAAHASASPRV